MHIHQKDFRQIKFLRNKDQNHHKNVKNHLKEVPKETLEKRNIKIQNRQISQADNSFLKERIKN